MGNYAGKTSHRLPAPGKRVTHHHSSSVGLSKNINRVSPAVGFVYAVTEIEGTGESEERCLKEEIIRHNDLILKDFDRKLKQHPAFVCRFRTLDKSRLREGCSTRPGSSSSTSSSSP
jgi:hypothetical protein